MLPIAPSSSPSTCCWKLEVSEREEKKIVLKKGLIIQSVLSVNDKNKVPITQSLNLLQRIPFFQEISKFTDQITPL
jgi:hypothetical protein